MKWVETEPNFRYEEIAELKSAIENNPADAALHFRLGQLYKRYYQQAAALDTFRHAVLLAPEKARHVIALANALVRKKEPLQALSLLNTIPQDHQSSAT